MGLSLWQHPCPNFPDGTLAQVSQLCHHPTKGLCPEATNGGSLHGTGAVPALPSAVPSQRVGHWRHIQVPRDTPLLTSYGAIKGCHWLCHGHTRLW